MGTSERPNADLIRTTMQEHGLSYEVAAAMLHVSRHTLHAWMKPSKPDAPAMAAELLCHKVRVSPPHRLTVQVRRNPTSRQWELRPSADA